MEYNTEEKNLEKIESQSPAQNMRGIYEYKNYKTYLQSKINHFLRFPDVKYRGKEIEFYLRGLLEAYDYFHKEEIEKFENLKLEVEIVNGWKGEGTIEIWKGFDNDFTIRTPIKDKLTGNVKWTVKEVKKEDLNRMIHIIKNLPLNEPVSCYEIANRLGYDWKDIWKYRTKIYFKIYYFPIKILESLKVIDYGGDGKITRRI